MASAWPWVLLLCVVAAAAGSVFQAGAQPDNKGFISIDCGLQGETGYDVDHVTQLSYAPDAGFTDAGTNHVISSDFVSASMAKSWYSLRRFASGTRNCYKLGFLVPGLKYLIRARFKYGNYDGLNRPPVFDLHIGVNYWHTVNISEPYESIMVEAIVVVTDDFVQVTTAQGLVLLHRLNFGPIDDISAVVRYPDDPYDRIWMPWFNTVGSTEISTEKKVQNTEHDPFEVPTAVMQTAISPRNGSDKIELSWDFESQLHHNPSPGYFVILHFSELQLLPSNTVRQFYANLNGQQLYSSGSGSFTPRYLYTGATYNRLPFQQSKYNISVDITATSTMPPILNAVEVFSVIPTTNVGTDSRDVSAITAIKTKYQVKKNWMGDPCVPKTMAWDKLTCSYAIGSSPRIVSVNMSSTGLTEDLPVAYFTATKNLVKNIIGFICFGDLSNNNLTGTIPDALSQLTSLTVLFIRQQAQWINPLWTSQKNSRWLPESEIRKQSQPLLQW
ncbi:hypothetical protein VPH35_016418 [Triticum aestivum]